MLDRGDVNSVQRIYYLAIEGRAGRFESVSQFTNGTFSIGRSPDCDIVLTSPEVSRLHARIVASNDSLLVEDLNSKCGTYVNGMQIKGLKSLTLESKVHIGPYRIHFDTRVEPLQRDDLTIHVLSQSKEHNSIDRLKQPPTMMGSIRGVQMNALYNQATARFSANSQSALINSVPNADEVLNGLDLNSTITINVTQDISEIIIEEVEPENPKSTLSLRYEVIRRLAEGSYGTIWVVQEKISKRYTALKILKQEFIDDKEMVDQFMIESIITARLQHPNILPVYDLGFLEHNQLYYTMRLVEGAKTSKVLADNTNQRRAIYVLAQSASAVAYAHRQNLMHLDLKPANLLIDNNDHCYVTDWGLVRVIPGRIYSLEMPNVVLPHMRRGRTSKSFDRSIQGHYGTNDMVANTMTRMASVFGDKIAGTWRYMAPEQAGGNPGPASDLWALGLMLYESLTGIHPYQLLNLRQDDIFAIARLTPGAIPSVAATAKRVNRRILFPKVALICDRALRMVDLPTFPDVNSFADALRESIGFDPVQRIDPADDASRRRLNLIEELATLPIFAIKRRREIKRELARLQKIETNTKNVIIIGPRNAVTDPTIRRK